MSCTENIEINKKPSVSIIMGVYNCKDKQLLLRSVISILNQSYTDFEFLICNDGSTDDTLLLLKEISKQDDRIQILTYENNRGLAYALNYCINNSKGRYIARQDDDDISKPNRIELQVQFLDTHMNYSIVGCNAYVYDHFGVWGEYLVEERPRKTSFLWNSPFLHPAVMMRKTDLCLINGYEICKKMRRCEDYDLFMRMYAKGYSGYNIQKKLYYYRIENKKNVKYRTINDRIREAGVRFRGYKEMGILMQGLPFVLKPIILGLIPQRIFYYIRKNRY